MPFQAVKRGHESDRRLRRCRAGRAYILRSKETMPEKDKDRTRDNSGRLPSIKVVGLGPGGLEDLTLRAKAALEAADCVVGYTRYVDLVRPLIDGMGKEVFS